MTLDICFGDRHTLEVLYTFVRAGMLSSARVIPFYAQPLAWFAYNLADITDSTAVAFGRQTLAGIEGRHEVV